MPKPTNTTLLTSILLVAAAAPNGAVQIDDQPQKLPVLLVSGANNHDWEWTHKSLAAILEESGRFDVTITLEPGKDLADEALLARMRAVVLDYNGPRWGEAAEQAFEQAVDAGLGVTVVHAANNAFEGWDEYEAIVGHLWREGTGHGRFHGFDVEIVQRSHPITAQLPHLYAHPDELYHGLVNTQGVSRRVLAEAHSDVATGGSGARVPMILVGRYGAARIFHTPLGHVWPDAHETRVSHEDPQFRNLIVRGTEWAASGHVSEVDPDAGVVPAELAGLGWRSLFDGESTDGWRSLREERFPSKGWKIVDRCLVHEAGGGGGDIITTEELGDFELLFEFMTAPGANSGVKIGIPAGGPAIGPEYQVLDDRGHSDGATASHRTGAIYDVLAPDKEARLLHPPGRWNQARILRREGTIEFWLNGRRTARADTATDEWRAAVAGSKFNGREDFGRFERGHILLQDHGDEVWFRNLFVRDLASPAGDAIELFDGESLQGWQKHGDAIYEVDEDSILGRIGGGGQSFLVSDEVYGDYVFEVDLINEDAGNSGVQFRSHLNDQGRLFGYQMEVDPSERSWSGGLYDEYRRAWLDNLQDNPAGRATFGSGEWNRYRIEARGPWLRAWVNGVPTMDHVDVLDPTGHFALQVHSGNNTRMRWKNFKLNVFPDPEVRQLEALWNRPFESRRCPISRGEDHAHAFLEARLGGTGSFQAGVGSDAIRIGIARTLEGGSSGMVAGAPGFRYLPLLQEGAVLFDETIAFCLVELAEADATAVSVTYMDDRLVLHRGDTLVLDKHVPPSRWGRSVQLFQCIAPETEGPPEGSCRWTAF